MVIQSNHDETGADGRVGQRPQVVIPRHICESLQLKEGDFVAFRRPRRRVLIKPKRMVDPDERAHP